MTPALLSIMLALVCPRAVARIDMAAFEQALRNAISIHHNWRNEETIRQHTDNLILFGPLILHRVKKQKDLDSQGRQAFMDLLVNQLVLSYLDGSENNMDDCLSAVHGEIEPYAQAMPNVFENFQAYRRRMVKMHSGHILNFIGQKKTDSQEAKPQANHHLRIDNLVVLFRNRGFGLQVMNAAIEHYAELEAGSRPPLMAILHGTAAQQMARLLNAILPPDLYQTELWNKLLCAYALAIIDALEGKESPEQEAQIIRKKIKALVSIDAGLKQSIRLVYRMVASIIVGANRQQLIEHAAAPQAEGQKVFQLMQLLIGSQQQDLVWIAKRADPELAQALQSLFSLAQLSPDPSGTSETTLSQACTEPDPSDPCFSDSYGNQLGQDRDITDPQWLNLPSHHYHDINPDDNDDDETFARPDWVEFQGAPQASAFLRSLGSLMASERPALALFGSRALAAFLNRLYGQPGEIAVKDWDFYADPDLLPQVLAQLPIDDKTRNHLQARQFNSQEAYHTLIRIDRHTLLSIQVLSYSPDNSQLKGLRLGFYEFDQNSSYNQDASIDLVFDSNIPQGTEKISLLLPHGDDNPVSYIRTGQGWFLDNWQDMLNRKDWPVLEKSLPRIQRWLEMETANPRMSGDSREKLTRLAHQIAEALEGREPGVRDAGNRFLWPESISDTWGKEAYFCSGCRELATDAMQCECGGTYCEDCVKTLEVREGKKLTLCSSQDCSNEVDANDFFPNRFIRKEIKQMLKSVAIIKPSDDKKEPVAESTPELELAVQAASPPVLAKASPPPELATQSENKPESDTEIGLGSVPRLDSVVSQNRVEIKKKLKAKIQKKKEQSGTSEWVGSFNQAVYKHFLVQSEEEMQKMKAFNERLVVEYFSGQNDDDLPDTDIETVKSHLDTLANYGQRFCSFYNEAGDWVEACRSILSSPIYCQDLIVTAWYLMDLYKHFAHMIKHIIATARQQEKQLEWQALLWQSWQGSLKINELALDLAKNTQNEKASHTMASFAQVQMVQLYNALESTHKALERANKEQQYQFTLGAKIFWKNFLHKADRDFYKLELNKERKGLYLPFDNFSSLARRIFVIQAIFGDYEYALFLMEPLLEALEEVAHDPRFLDISHGLDSSALKDHPDLGNMLLVQQGQMLTDLNVQIMAYYFTRMQWLDQPNSPMSETNQKLMKTVARVATKYQNSGFTPLATRKVLTDLLTTFKELEATLLVQKQQQKEKTEQNAEALLTELEARLKANPSPLKNARKKYKSKMSVKAKKKTGKGEQEKTPAMEPDHPRQPDEAVAAEPEPQWEIARKQARKLLETGLAYVAKKKYEEAINDPGNAAGKPYLLIERGDIALASITQDSHLLLRWTSKIKSMYADYKASASANAPGQKKHGPKTQQAELFDVTHGFNALLSQLSSSIQEALPFQTQAMHELLTRRVAHFADQPDDMVEPSITLLDVSIESLQTLLDTLKVSNQMLMDTFEYRKQWLKQVSERSLSRASQRSGAESLSPLMSPGRSTPASKHSSPRSQGKPQPSQAQETSQQPSFFAAAQGSRSPGGEPEFINPGVASGSTQLPKGKASASSPAPRVVEPEPVDFRPLLKELTSKQQLLQDVDYELQAVGQLFSELRQGTKKAQVPPAPSSRTQSHQGGLLAVTHQTALSQVGETKQEHGKKQENKKKKRKNKRRSRENWQEIVIRGDGNCFYHALSEGVRQTIGVNVSSEDLRKKLHHLLLELVRVIEVYPDHGKGSERERLEKQLKAVLGISFQELKTMLNNRFILDSTHIFQPRRQRSRHHGDTGFLPFISFLLNVPLGVISDSVDEPEIYNAHDWATSAPDIFQIINANGVHFQIPQPASFEGHWIEPPFFLVHSGSDDLSWHFNLEIPVPPEQAPTISIPPTQSPTTQAPPIVLQEELALDEMPQLPPVTNDTRTLMEGVLAVYLLANQARADSLF